MNGNLMKIASCLEELAAAVRDMAVEEAPSQAGEQPTPAPKLEDVRAVLADLSRKGHTKEMKELLSRFGAKKLSDVDPKDYAALLTAAKEVPDA